MRADLFRLILWSVDQGTGLICPRLPRRIRWLCHGRGQERSNDDDQEIGREHINTEHFQKSRVKGMEGAFILALLYSCSCRRILAQPSGFRLFLSTPSGHGRPIVMLRKGRMARGQLGG